jgi:hypothetical protein
MMASRTPLLVAATMATVALVSQTAAAQSAQRWSVQGSGIAVVPSGSAYDGLSSGVGVEAQVRFTPSVFSIGLGFQFSSHDLDIGTGTKETVQLAGGFVEPRYVIDIHSSVAAPYLSARIAVLTQSATIDQYDLSASGTQVNGGGGVLVRVAPRVNLDFGLTYGAIHFQDVVVKSGGQTLTVNGSSGNGTNLVLRIGAAVGLSR